MNDRCIEIAGRRVGAGAPTYMIAELSANHGRRYEMAADLVTAAARAGADAIKVQTYTPDTMTIKSHSGPFVHGEGSPWAGQSLYDLYAEAYMPWEWQPRLQVEAHRLGLDFFSTPFDVTAVDFLSDMDVPAFKIASFELVDIPLLRKIAETQKPVIVSTGMSTRGEIDEAIRTLREFGANQVALLKCTSSYPAPPGEMNLKTIPHMAKAFGVPVGVSDHTLGNAVSIAAVALGASIVERHVTLSRDEKGPDSAFSLEPDEFAALVRDVREVEQAMGGVSYEVMEHEKGSRAFRRSLFVVRDVSDGEPFTERNVRCIRPGCGLHPRHLAEVLERCAARDIERATPLSWDLVE